MTSDAVQSEQTNPSTVAVHQTRQRRALVVEADLEVARGRLRRFD
jgi:hypothetical protein